MKKFLALVLALGLAMALSATAFAEDTKISPDPDNDYEPNPSTANTSVEFTVNPAYTITIPAQVTLEAAEDGTYAKDEEIATDGAMLLLNNQKIQVKLSAGEGGFVLKTEEGASVKYTVTVDGTAVIEGGLVAEFTTDTAVQTATLHFAAEEPEYAGTYKGNVVFTISIA